MSITTTTILKIISGSLLAALTLTASASAQSLGPVDLYKPDLLRQYELERIPKNFARWHMGASLIQLKDQHFQRIPSPRSADFQEAALLSDHSASTFPIQSGPHDYIIDFGQFVRLSRCFLNNRSAGGQFTLRSSDTLDPLDSAKWLTLSAPVDFSPDLSPAIDFPEVETRFLWVHFNIHNPGMIGNFGATGPLNITLADFTLAKDADPAHASPTHAIDYDFAAIYSGARIAYISAGPLDQIYKLHDEDPTTAYPFPAKDSCVFILDLNQQTPVHAFSATFKTTVPGHIHIDLVDHLPPDFENPDNVSVATLTRADGSISRAELAARESPQFKHFMAAQKAREVFHIPEDYFRQCDATFSAPISPDQDRLWLPFSELARQFLIVRFIPDSTADTPLIQSALYRPGASHFKVQRAQSLPLISFSQIELIGRLAPDRLEVAWLPEPDAPGRPPRLPTQEPEPFSLIPNFSNKNAAPLPAQQTPGDVTLFPKKRRSPRTNLLR